MKKKRTTKVKPQSKRLPEKLKTIIKDPPFHIVFPITLYHKAEKKHCYFQCEHHVKSYITRYNLKTKDYILTETAPRVVVDDYETGT